VKIIRSHTLLVLLLLLLLFQVQVVELRAQATGGQGDEIDVTADKLEVEEAGKVIRAEGNVEIKRGETSLKASKVKVNRETQDVEAEGDVVVDSPDWQLKAKGLQLNLPKETAVIRDGEIYIESNHLSLTGRRFEKFTGQAYHIDDGSFTTCLCESGTPTWRITAKEIELTPEGEGIIRIRGGKFYIYNVPVFYLPYGFFPVRTKRKTGFLFPKPGYSNREGFTFQQPFFWAISKSTDATIVGNIQTRARAGIWGEFRHIFSRNTDLRFNAAYFNEFDPSKEENDIVDKNIANPTIPRNRWAVGTKFRNSNASGWETYSDVFAFSDDLFTRDLFDKFDLDDVQERNVRTSRYGRSNVGFFKGSSDVYLRGEWDFYQDFIQPDDFTLFGVPKVYFGGRKGIGGPFELSWRVEGVNYMRREKADGARLDIRPEITLPFRLSDYLFGSLDVAPRETLYYLYRTEGVFDQTTARTLVEVRGNVGSSVSNTFSWNGTRLKKIKHVMEPEIHYLFIPWSNQKGIPIWDGTDRINRRNLLTFSFTNRFWGKFARKPVKAPKDKDVELLGPATTSDVKEIARLGFALSYDIDKERFGGDSLSDLDVDLRVNPGRYLNLGVQLGVDPGAWRINQAVTRLALTDPRPLPRRELDKDFNRPNELTVSYRYIRENFLTPLAENANIPVDPLDPLALPAPTKDTLGQVGTHALLHVGRRILLQYDFTYDAIEGKTTSNRGRIKLLSKCGCWTLSMAVNRTTNPSRTSVQFGFDLLGLSSGNVGSFNNKSLSP
jgi:LPS-assembly protein